MLAFNHQATNVENELYKFCDELLTYDLMVNNIKLELAEIEIYYKSNNHDDPFVHGNPQQLKNLTWYFHRQTDHGKYKGGSYKGLDITFGNDSAYGGILIRSVHDTGSLELIEGPCNCVNYILNKTGMSSVTDLVTSLSDLSIMNRSNIIHLVKSNRTNTAQSFGTARCPRVGLTLKKKDYVNKRVEYIGKNYRLLTYPKLIKKAKFLIICGLYQQGKSINEIITITGSKKGLVNRHITAYDGYGVLNNYQKGLGVTDTCKMLGYCNSI